MVENLHEFQNRVLREYHPSFGHKEQVYNNAFGIVGEAGEIADLVKKEYHIGKPVTTEDYIEEIGDLLWHIACFCNVKDITLEECIEGNRVKLEERYGKYGKQLEQFEPLCNKQR
jgi:NTP pyrophosphatase (non-canonical NTP hydrolase)